MPTITRLADSCLQYVSGSGTTLIDPGFFSFESDQVDLGSLGDVQRVLITHEHRDHVDPAFLRWLIDRGDDVAIHANQAVAELLAEHDIEVSTSAVDGVAFEDVTHEMTPMGTAPPNRAYTVESVLTHPGDSYEPASTGAVLALPLLTLWGSTTQSVEFARRLGPRQVVPIHDFYVSASGREWIYRLVQRSLSDSGIELVPLDWGEGYEV